MYLFMYLLYIFYIIKITIDYQNIKADEELY